MEELSMKDEEIRGLRGSSKVLGVTQYVIGKLLSHAFGGNNAPLKVPNHQGTKGFSWRWRNEEHVRSWYQEARLVRNADEAEAFKKPNKMYEAESGEKWMGGVLGLPFTVPDSFFQEEPGCVYALVVRPSNYKSPPDAAVWVGTVRDLVASPQVKKPSIVRATSTGGDWVFSRVVWQITSDPVKSKANAYRFKEWNTVNWDGEGWDPFDLTGEEAMTSLNFNPEDTATLTKTAAPVPMPSPPVVGVRAAASALGVSKSLFYAVLKRLGEENPDLLPSVTKVRLPSGQQSARTSYTWPDENVLANWWERVREASDDSVPPALDTGDPEPVEFSSDVEETINFLLGEGTTAELSRLRERMDTPEVRALRAARGEEPELPLEEVLVLVVGLGLVSWPEGA